MKLGVHLISPVIDKFGANLCTPKWYPNGAILNGLTLCLLFKTPNSRAIIKNRGYTC